MRIETAYDIGEIVFLITDEEQAERIITRVYVNPNGVAYELSCGIASSTHFEMEMTRTLNIHKQLNIPNNEADKK